MPEPENAPMSRLLAAMLTATLTAMLPSAAALTILVGGLTVASQDAEAGGRHGRHCREAYCARRAPFVCPGPIGSCGFAQGKCLEVRHRMVRCGKEPVVR